MHTIAVLLVVLAGLLFGLLAWGLLRTQSYEVGVASIETRDGVLVGLLVLAAFALGVFVSYLVISIG